MRLTYYCTKKDEGRLLRDVLRSELLLSKRLVRRLKQDENGILINGERRTVRAEVHEGDVVSVAASPERSTTLFPEPGALDVFYEDAHCLVALKPRGVTMYPRYQGESGAFSGAVLYHLQKTDTSPRFFPLYRLDRCVSGLVLLAKSSHAAERLKRSGIEKVYQALAFGKTPQEGLITAPIVPANEALRGVGTLFAAANDGKPSMTAFRALLADNIPMASPLMIYLKTGRRHQIRVHLAHFGHPLWGDVRYGGPVDRGYPLLHAAYLSFYQPFIKENVNLFYPMQDAGARWTPIFGKEDDHADYLASILSRCPSPSG